MSKEFKSRTFRFGFPEGEHLSAFKEDIIALKDLKESKIEEGIKYVKKLIETNTKKEKYSLFDEAVESKIVNNHSTIYSLFRVSKYFFEKFQGEDTKRDEPKIIVLDISKGLEIEKNKLATIEILLEKIKKESEWYKQEELKENFEKGLFPNIRGVGTTVGFRGVFNREIRFGEIIEDYSKEVNINEENPLIPTISVALTLDSGSPNRFIFQISPKNTEWLIEELKAALYKVKILNEKYNLE